jgi:hypothetical protein
MIISGTGHRPDKVCIGGLNGYHPSVHVRVVELARDALVRLSPSRTISGMAQCWDTALAEASLELTIPFDAYIPFEGQESKWPPAAQRRYRDLLARARSVVVVCAGGYHPEKMQRRNVRMVDDSDLVLALFNGSRGGTFNCIEYARSMCRRTENLWQDWLRLTGAADATPPRRESSVFTALLAAAGGK